jgi:hypothetical protein
MRIGIARRRDKEMKRKVEVGLSRKPFPKSPFAKRGAGGFGPTYYSAVRHFEKGHVFYYSPGKIHFSAGIAWTIAFLPPFH